MEKNFWKTNRNNWRSRKKQVEALENLIPKEQAKTIEGKSNNQSIATIIFNDLISKRKKMSELYDSVDKNK